MSRRRRALSTPLRPPVAQTTRLDSTEGGQWVARPTPTAALTDQLGQSRTDAAALSAYSTAAELRQWLRARSPPWDWGVPTSQIRHPKNTYVSNRTFSNPPGSGRLRPSRFIAVLGPHRTLTGRPSSCATLACRRSAPRLQPALSAPSTSAWPQRDTAATPSGVLFTRSPAWVACVRR